MDAVTIITVINLIVLGFVGKRNYKGKGKEYDDYILIGNCVVALGVFTGLCLKYMI